MERFRNLHTNACVQCGRAMSDVICTFCLLPIRMKEEEERNENPSMVELYYLFVSLRDKDCLT